MKKQTKEQILNGLKREINETLWFFVQMDFLMYGLSSRLIDATYDGMFQVKTETQNEVHKFKSSIGILLVKEDDIDERVFN